MQINKCNISCNGLEDRNHVVIPIDPVNAFNKISHCFIIKNSEEVRNEGNTSQLNKTIQDKPLDCVMLSEERLAFTLILSGQILNIRPEAWWHMPSVLEL